MLWYTVQDQDTHPPRCQECWPLAMHSRVSCRNCSWLKRASLLKVIPPPQAVHIQWLVMQAWKKQVLLPQLWTSLMGHYNSGVSNWGLCYKYFTVQLLPLPILPSWAPSYKWFMRALSHKCLECKESSQSLREWTSSTRTKVFVPNG